MPSCSLTQGRAPRRAAFPLVLCSLLLAVLACGETSGPVEEPRVIPRPVGAYYAVSRDGVPFRIRLADSAGWRRELVTVRLEFGPPIGITGSEVFSLTALTPVGGGAQWTQSRTDGVRDTMLTDSTFRVQGTSYLSGLGTLEGDSVIRLTSDATALTGSHLWRLIRVGARRAH